MYIICAIGKVEITDRIQFEIKLNKEIDLDWFNYFYNSYLKINDLIVDDESISYKANTNILIFCIPISSKIDIQCDVIKDAIKDANDEYKEDIENQEHEIYEKLNELLIN